MDLKYLLKVFIIFIIILSVILFINSIGFKFTEPTNQKVLVGSATIEGFKPEILSGKDAFCQNNIGFQQETECSKLTNYNCNLTSCCVWTSDNKCKAGSIKGPTFNSDSKGKTIPLDYYYYQNKCYGTNCR
jgi:hypothetical protein